MTWAGATSTGIPFTTAFPDGAPTRCPGASRLLFTRVLRRDPEAHAVPVVAPAVGQADDTGHHLVAHLHGGHHRARLG